MKWKIILLTGVFFTMKTAFSQTYLSGFDKAIYGEEFNYHAPQPDARRALLIRSLDAAGDIAWQTQPVPVDFKQDTAQFLMLAGIDVNKDDPRKWDVFINDKKHFTIQSPRDTSQKTITWMGPENSNLQFRVTEIDKYGDFMGYLILSLPGRPLQKGKPVHIKMVGESAGSRTWFMVFQYAAKSKAEFVAENAIRKNKTGQFQVLRSNIVYYGKPAQATIQIDDKKEIMPVHFGYNRHYLFLPEISVEKPVMAEVTIDNKLLTRKQIVIKPVRRRTIYLLHHSHNDIGYTHVQDEVARIQWKNLENAVALAAASQNNPEGERFKWNVEVMWAVESYLREKPAPQRAALIEAIKNDWIGLDALFANELTGLCNPEELIRLMEPARKIAGECGVQLQAAMISDIPGWTWGLVPALARSGVKYLSLGTNAGHRIGSIIKTWGDRPFYWVSPSGEEKLLCWIHEKGYSYFHTGLDFTKMKNKLNEDKIFPYLNELDERNYPYGMVMLRYNIGADNGPTDPDLAETVKTWNEKYVSPRLVISTVAEAFAKFEAKYGAGLPEVRGDFTGYWEDGAASSARETAINRSNAGRLVQAQALWSMLRRDDYPQMKFSDAWRDVLLYDEHTWGSWNSISDPEADFTKRQWEIKRSFAMKAHKTADELIAGAVEKRKADSESVRAVEIFNTQSWPRTDAVFLPAAFNLSGSVLLSEDGEEIAVQQLSTGEYIFIAENIPPLGSKIFRVAKRKVDEQSHFRFTDHSIAGGFCEISVNPGTGAIRSLKIADSGLNIVNQSRSFGLNEFLYVSGRNPDNLKRVQRVSISRKENGPVLASLLVSSSAPGCKNLLREIRLYRGLNRIDLINTIDKEKIYNPEGVHFAFPFNIPNGSLRYDLAFAVCRPQQDQIPAANKNFFTINRCVDISNRDFGITWVSPDAPLIEIGNITCDPVAYGWLDTLRPSTTFFSYVMNNYWETNYKAAQEGVAQFRYCIFPHGKYNSTRIKKWGVEQRQPLIAIQVRKGTKPVPSLQDFSESSIVLISLRSVNGENMLLLTLFNAGEKPETLNWRKQPKEIYLSDFDGRSKERIAGSLQFLPYAVRNLLVRLE